MSETITVFNPATEEAIGEVPALDRANVDAAVHRARAAQAEWSRRPLAERRDALWAIAEAVLEHREELALLESTDVGKPLTAAREQIQGVAECFKYYAGVVDKIFGDTIPVDGGISMTFREPMGVVVVISPWNFPLPIASWNVAPALACGNAVIVKPATLTPLSTVRFGEIVQELGVVGDALQVVTGAGSEVGSALTEHPLVNKISFTGSTETGRSILQTASHTMKRVTLELGGKSASIVFNDAPLEECLRAAPMSVFDNTGQDCCARSRFLVQRGVFDEFVEGFAESTRALRIGDPLHSETQLGPLVSASHRKDVMGFLEKGLNVLTAGEEPDGPGHWMAPRIVVAPDPNSRVVKDEIFGPIVSVIPFDTEDEAIALANDTIYGLSGSIWTNDVGQALRVARGVETGSLSVNSNSSVRVQTPLGGFKQSGLGRELGQAAIEGYTELKTVFIRTGRDN
jgi:acyl-CoA reductase-like NAD-dependent aldehyde dehydrogenase